MEMLKPLSSTNTRRLASKWEASHRHKPLASSSRSEAISVTFFHRPPTIGQASYCSANGCGGDPLAELLLESLTVLFESKVVVGLQVLPGSQLWRISPFLEGLLGIGLGCTSPVSRRLLSQRFMVGIDTEKVLATSSLGVPASTVESTLNLRSFEYGFISRG